VLYARPIHVDFPRLNYVYPVSATDILVNSVGGQRLNGSYRDVNHPIHVEPAARLHLSPQALEILTRERKNV